MTRHILIVDDDREIRDLAALILEGAGYQVGTAGSGFGALDAVSGRTYDLILLDVNMPDMDGWETLRLLKSDDHARRLPVVMFTVKNEVRDKVHAMQDGAVDFITKPFAYDELLGRISHIFQTLEVRP